MHCLALFLVNFYDSCWPSTVGERNTVGYTTALKDMKHRLIYKIRPIGRRFQSLAVDSKAQPPPAEPRIISPSGYMHMGNKKKVLGDAA